MEPVRENTIERMTDAIAHRGPDDEGMYVKGHVGLGHRRLSIIDVTPSGHQPMTYGDSGCWMVYNGEVYNYIELREELRKLGYNFISESDTEVILAAYIHWGIDAFEKFNGMWALAIYDSRRDELLLHRDRYGIKPLYYYVYNNTIAFASEYKSFFAVRDELKIDFDQRGLATALLNPFELEASDKSLLTNVYNLLPGTYLKVSREKVEKHTWWRTVDHIESVPKSRTDQVNRFRELFEDSCRLRMRSDVPVGTSLSGGLDSSAVVATLAKLKIGTNKTFIHTFKGNPLDESYYADIVVQSTSTSAHYIEVEKEDLIQFIDTILYYSESINNGMVDSPYRIYKMQRQNGVIVSLDGHGADEMLGGYEFYMGEYYRDINPLFHPGRLKECLSTYKSLIEHPQFIDKFQTMRFILQYSRLGSLLKMLVRRNPSKNPFMRKFFSKEIETYTAPRPDLPAGWSHLLKRLYTDFHHTVLPRILKNFDLMSMANSVEVRMPFMDYRLVSYVFSLDNSAKIGDGYTKNILRQSMEGVLDDRVRLRKSKIGFNSPMLDWFHSDMQPWIEDILYSSSYEIDIIDKKKLRNFNETRVKTGQFSWSDGYEFWKYLSALKLTRCFKDRFAIV